MKHIVTLWFRDSEKADSFSKDINGISCYVAMSVAKRHYNESIFGVQVWTAPLQLGMLVAKYEPDTWEMESGKG